MSSKFGGRFHEWVNDNCGSSLDWSQQPTWTISVLYFRQTSSTDILCSVYQEKWSYQLSALNYNRVNNVSVCWWIPFWVRNVISFFLFFCFVLIKYLELNNDHECDGTIKPWKLSGVYRLWELLFWGHPNPCRPSSWATPSRPCPAWWPRGSCLSVRTGKTTTPKGLTLVFRRQIKHWFHSFRRWAPKPKV